LYPRAVCRSLQPRCLVRGRGRSIMAERDVADLPSDAIVGEPQDRGGGFHRYQSFRVVRDGVTMERDSLRIGKVAVILPVDLDRDEIVLIRQFRLSAQLALGLGELIEV